MFYQIKMTEVEVPKLGFLPAIVIEWSAAYLIPSASTLRNINMDM